MAKQNNFDICPVCGNRSRKSECILCIVCRKKFDEQVDRSAQALIDGDFESVVAMPDIFQHVLDYSLHTVNSQRNRLAEAEAQLQAEEERIFSSVKNTIQSRLLKGGVNPGQEVVQRAVSCQVQKIKDQDEKYKAAYGRVFGLTRGFENLRDLVREVKAKRQVYLAEQKTQTAVA